MRSDSVDFFLIRGHCNKGHTITSSDQIYRYDDTRANSNRGCRQCRSEWSSTRVKLRPKRAQGRPRLRPAATREARRFMNLSCGHTPVFSIPLPRLEEVLWCQGCESPSEVVSWGEEAGSPNGKVSK